ncbi:PrpF domain-containing protein [Paenibacillus sp. PvP091]|uniref:PrpF domain-containing protein n=1 Tax=Paenibacillus sp. PvP091 TaxID=2806590 RepID=UPI001AE7B44B
MEQLHVPCAVYRGGTSRGLFFHQKDLPDDEELKAHIFLTGIGAPDETQVNGLGGGSSHTSKIVIISPSDQPGAHVNYTFVQAGTKGYVLDDKGTCGNLMAAVGAFAIDEHLVNPAEDLDRVTVHVYNTNINKHLQIKVPVQDGAAKVKGDFAMPGVTNPGAKITVDIMQPGGGKTGTTLPLGSCHTIQAGGYSDTASLVDIVNPFVYISADKLGLSGTEGIQELSANTVLIDQLNHIRDQACIDARLALTLEQARKECPAIPKIAIVGKPQDYVTTSGRIISKSEVDVVARMLSMGKFHKTFAVSGLLNLAAAVLLQGTIPNLVAGKELQDHINPGKVIKIRIGHADGIAEIRVVLTPDLMDVESVGLERTARRIMTGQLYVPSLTHT